MRSTAYRRRRDGVLVIERPSTRARDVAIAAGIAAAVIAVCVALALALAVHLLIGVPLAFAGLVYLSARLIRRRSDRRVRLRLGALTPRDGGSVEPLRRVRVRAVQPPTVTRTRNPGVTVRPPERDGAVVISIPGTAASRQE